MGNLLLPQLLPPLLLLPRWKVLVQVLLGRLKSGKNLKGQIEIDNDLHFMMTRHACALADWWCFDLADSRELHRPRLVDGDAKGRRSAIQDHAEAAGVGLDDSGDHRAAGDPWFRCLARDEVHARGEGHHHARAAIALRCSPGENQRHQHHHQTGHHLDSFLGQSWLSRRYICV